MRKQTGPLVASLLASVCLTAPASADTGGGGGNHYGWCQGVGNPHHSTGCGGLPGALPDTHPPVVPVNSANEVHPQYPIPPQPPEQREPPDPVVAVPQPILPPQQVPQPSIPQQPAAQQVPPDPVVAVPQPILPPQQVPQATLGPAQVPVTSHVTVPAGHLAHVFNPLTLVVPVPGRQHAGQLHRTTHGSGEDAAHNVCLVSGMGRRRLREDDEEVGQLDGFHLTDAIVRDLPFDRHAYAGCFISVERRWHLEHPLDEDAAE